MLQSLIERVNCWLAANRPDYYASLRPGLPEAALRGFESRFGLRLPEGFRLFYMWRNGQSPSSGASLQGNRMFSSLEEVQLLDSPILQLYVRLSSSATYSMSFVPSTWTIRIES